MMPRLRLSDRLVLGAMVGPFTFGVMIFTLIFVAGDLLFQAARLVIERGVALGVVTRLFLYRLPEVVAMTLPMASLLATLLGMSALSGANELVALRSLGVRSARVLRPVAWASLLVSIVALSFNETIVPITSLAADRLMKYEILKGQAQLVQEKVFLRDESGGELRRVLYVDRLDAGEGVMSGIMVHEFEAARLVRTLSAAQGTWQDGEWWIEDGRVYEVGREGDVGLLLRFERQRLVLALSPEQLRMSARKPSEMSARELWRYIRASGSMAGGGLPRLWAMFHLKLAVPWACVIMAVLGASLGASGRARGGGGVGFGISVALVFAYYVVMSLCRALGEAGSIPPWLAGWGANIVFLVVAVSLAVRADRS